MTVQNNNGVGQQEQVYDFVIIGSGFGGSVSAMRLTEKGYSVLVLERGKRFRDQDFARSDWEVRRYLWLPAMRCFGILQMTFLPGVSILHGSGVGGGSLVYANVLEEPDDRLFEAPAWQHLANWKDVLRPHYATARRMLGVATNPCLWPADAALRAIADDLGWGDTFRPTQVGVFFGEEGETVPDPYFDGEGPPRTGCTHCGGCMVGCRYNAKNTLPKNYLYFAEKWGAEIRAEAEVRDIRPLPDEQPDGARYEVVYRRPTAWLTRPLRRVRARNVVVAAGVLGTQRLLLRCRDETRSLAAISPQLGERVRTNSEALLGVASRDRQSNYSQGVAITSIFQADQVTQIEPVRYPEGSSLTTRFMAIPLIEAGTSILERVFKTLAMIVRYPVDFLESKLMPGWGRRVTVLLVMQTEDNLMRLRLGRSLVSLFRRGLVVERDTERPVSAEVGIAHRVARAFADKIDGFPYGNFNEGLLNIPFTAHIMGGVPIGRDLEEGVVDMNFEVFNYAGLYVIDGSIMPANPGVNPSLTIAALAEYAMSRIPPKEGQPQRSLSARAEPELQSERIVSTRG